MSSSQPELKDVIKEIQSLRNKIERLEKIIESRLIEEVMPDKYEKKALAEFEKNRKAGKLEFSSLS